MTDQRWRPGEFIDEDGRSYSRDSVGTTEWLAATLTLHAISKILNMSQSGVSTTRLSNR